MKKIIIFFILANINYVLSQDVKHLRKLYLTSYNNKSTCDSLSIYLNLFDKKNNTIDAYIGANNLLISKFSKNIIKKFKYFEEGKNLIEQAIKNDPKNIEILFKISDHYFSSEDYESAFTTLLNNYSKDKERVKKKLVEYF